MCLCAVVMQFGCVHEEHLVCIAPPPPHGGVLYTDELSVTCLVIYFCVRLARVVLVFALYLPCDVFGLDSIIVLLSVVLVVPVDLSNRFSDVD